MWKWLKQGHACVQNELRDDQFVSVNRSFIWILRFVRYEIMNGVNFYANQLKISLLYMLAKNDQHFFATFDLICICIIIFINFNSFVCALCNNIRFAYNCNITFSGIKNIYRKLAPNDTVKIGANITTAGLYLKWNAASINLKGN